MQGLHSITKPSQPSGVLEPRSRFEICEHGSSSTHPAPPVTKTTSNRLRPITPRVFLRPTDSRIFGPQGTCDTSLGAFQDCGWFRSRRPGGRGWSRLERRETPVAFGIQTRVLFAGWYGALSATQRFYACCVPRLPFGPAPSTQLDIVLHFPPTNQQHTHMRRSPITKRAGKFPGKPLLV